MRNKIIIALALSPLTLVSLPAKAAYNLPWCAHYVGYPVRSCSFFTFQQCQASISGVGGYCDANPFVPPPPPPGAVYRRAKPHHAHIPH